MKKLVLLAMAALLIQSVAFAADPIKIGVSFSDFATERWPVEEKLMKELAAQQGVEIVSQVANHDAKLQNDQIENLALQGVKAMIIIAEDGAAAASAVDAAAAAGIPCIAYDRLIKSANLAAYISFDNVAVGRAQGEGVLKRVNKGKFVLLGGSPTDNNAILFRKGQMEALQPFMDSSCPPSPKTWQKRWHSPHWCCCSCKS